MPGSSGGGPAGSTVAALLAERGWSVALVERARHPRFHIGESLLPMNLPIFERLGVLDQVAAIGVKKEGADFAAAPGGGCVSYPFAHALGDSPSHAFQVHRAELDELLAAEGADESGHKHRFTARYLVDATGRATLAGRQRGGLRPRRHPGEQRGHGRLPALPRLERVVVDARPMAVLKEMARQFLYWVRSQKSG